MAYCLKILLLLMVGLNVALADNPPPEDARRSLYVFYKKGGKYYGADAGMAYPDKYYEYPPGETMYYCKDPQGAPNKIGRQCCGQVLDGVREIFVCTDSSCKDGEYEYLSESGRLVGTSETRSQYADPHRQYEAHLTRLRVCGE